MSISRLANDYGLASGLLGLTGYGPMLRAIVRGSYRPPRLPWVIFALQTAVLVVGQSKQGVGWALSLPVLQFLGGLLVLAMIRRKKAERSSLRDQLMLLVVCGALALVLLNQNTTWALCVAMAVEALGMLIIARHAYREPWAAEGSILTWWLFADSGILDIPAVAAKSPVVIAYPVLFTAMAAIAIIAFEIGSRHANNADPENDVW